MGHSCNALERKGETLLLLGEEERGQRERETWFPTGCCWSPTTSTLNQSSRNT